MGRPTKSPNPNAAAPAAPAGPMATPAVQVNHGGAVSSAAVLPEFGTVVDTAPLPTVDARGPFVLLWNIKAWHVMAGLLVPALRNLRLTPGVANVALGRDGRWQLGRARSEWERKGDRLIPPERGPQGSYMRTADVDPGGEGRRRVKHYHTAWETLYSGSPRSVVNEQAYAEWCASLVEDGTIPPCPLPIARALYERTIEKLSAVEQKVTAGAASLASQVTALRKEAEVIAAHIATIEDNAAAVPVTSSLPDFAEVADVR